MLFSLSSDWTGLDKWGNCKPYFFFIRDKKLVNVDEKINGLCMCKAETLNKEDSQL